MSRQYNLVVFDWEGTLAEDAYGQVVRVLEAESAKLQLTGFDKIMARKFAPYGLLGMVSQLFPELGMHQQEKLLERLQEELTAAQSQVTLANYAAETVRKIHAAGIMLGIATNRSLSSLQRVLSLSGLEQYFQAIRTASQAPAKPCTDMLEEIILECNTTSAATLMVGDSLSDIEMAVKLGVDAIAVDFYREQTNTFLNAGASLEIDDYYDLLKFLKI